MRRSLRLAALGIFFAVVLVFAVLLHTVAHSSWWAALLIALVAVLINGWVMTWEDNQPGGFNNPKPPDSDTKE